MLQDLLKSNNYSIKNDILTIKYVTSLEKDNLIKIEKDLLYFLKDIHFPLKSIQYELNKEKQNQILENENIKRKDIQKLVEQSKQLLGEQEQYDRKFKVSGKFTDLREIDKDFAGMTVNVSGEIVSAEKRESKKNNSISVYSFIIYDYAGGALKCSFMAFKTTKYPFAKKYIDYGNIEEITRQEGRRSMWRSR